MSYEQEMRLDWERAQPPWELTSDVDGACGAAVVALRDANRRGRQRF